MIKQPTIEINFKQLVQTFVQRSARGNVVLLIKDDTNKSFTQKVYRTTEELEIDKALYTVDNALYINDCLEGKPNKVTVIRVDAAKTFSDALKLAEPLKTGWIGFVGGSSADYDALFTWIKAMAAKKYTFMGLGFKPTTPPNSEYCHTLVNDKVVFKDIRGEVTTDKAIPTLLGICAGANVESGLTYKIIPSLKAVTEVADIDAEINKGNLVLTCDDIVKIVVGINSLTTLTSEQTEDFKYIEVIEINNLIRDDITAEFKTWIGKYKNTTDNQILFLSAVNSYLKALADMEILDKNFDNKAELDLAAQKAAWITVNPLAADWDETKVKNMPFKRSVFLKGNIKELQSMTDLSFHITMT